MQDTTRANGVRQTIAGEDVRFASRIFLTALLVAFVPSAWAQNSANVTGATIDWFGVYGSEETEIKDPNVSTGQHYTSSNIVPPTTNSDEIILTPATRFGFGFTLTGEGSGNVVLTQIYKYPSPGMPRGNSGRYVSTDKLPFTYAFGSGNVMGYNVGSDPSGWPAGTWTFQLWSGDRLLIEKIFTVAHR